MIFNHLYLLNNIYSIKKTTRGIALLLALMMLFPLAAGAAADAPAQTAGKTGIDYSIADITVTGKIDGNQNGAYYINLTKETLTVPPDYIITAYSVDGGSKWTAVNAKTKFDSAAMVKLFTKDVTLAFTDKYDGKTKKPAKDATVVKFPKINKRLSMKTYTVNYLIGADPSGATPGTWVLTERGGSTSLKEGIEVAAADSAGKAPDSKGYGRFFGKNGTNNGIGIVPLPANGKPVETSYFIRQAAKANSDGTYTLASSAKKITVKGQQKPPSYKVDNKKKTISHSANTYVYKEEKKDKDDKNNGNNKNSRAELKKSSGKVDVSDFDGDVYLWSPATASEPASAMQRTSIEQPASANAAISAASETVNFTTFSGDLGDMGIMAAAAYVIGFAPAGNAITANGVTATGSITHPDSPFPTQNEGENVQVTVVFSGLTLSSGTHTLKLTSQTVGATNISPTDHTFTVSAGQAVAQCTFVFVMPSKAVNDLVIEHEALIPVTGITLNNYDAKLVLGIPTLSSSQLTAAVQPNNASNKTVTWTSSDANVATVSNTGLITAVAVGTTTVTVTTADGGYTAACNVTVIDPILVDSITLNRLEVFIQAGNTEARPEVSYNPADATTKTVTWSSSNANVATVNASTGQVTAISAGTATITATTADGSNKTATYTVIVSSTPPPAPGFAITTTTLPDGLRGRNYTALQLTTNRPGEYVTWNTITNNGLTLSSTGILSGVPESVMTMNLTVTATYREDGTGPSENVSKTLTLIVNPTYEVTIAVLNGVGGSVWAVSDGDGVRSATTKTDAGVKFYVPYSDPNVTFTATPDTTYQVKQWMPNIGTISIDKTELKRSLNGDLQVTVEFEKSPDYRIEFYAVDENGTVIGIINNTNPITAKIVGGKDVTSPATAEEGNIVEFTANLPGYKVKSWDGKVINAGTNTNPEKLFNTLNASTGSTTRLNLPKVSNLGVNLTNPSNQVRITVVVTYEPAPPVITTAVMPDGAIGVTYSQTLAATSTLPNADIKWKWEKVSGDLPPSFTLNENTGLISGMPTIGGTYTFSVRVTDGRTGIWSETKTFSIKIPGQYAVTFEVVNNLGGTIKADVYNGTVLEKENITSGALVNDGRDVVFTVAPDTANGYKLGSWAVTSGASYTHPTPDNTSATYKATRITDTVDVKVTFTRTQEYSVNFGIASGKGTITAARTDTGAAIQPGAYVPLNTEIEFSAKPTAGYRVTQWEWKVTPGTLSQTIGTNTEQYKLKITGNTEINVTLSPIYAVTSFTLNKNSTTIPGRGSEQLIPVLTPANTPPEIVEWASSNPQVAAVDENGVVTGKSAGTTVITATVPGALPPVTCTVTVTPVSVLRINDVTDTAITGIPLELTGVIDPVFALLAKQPANAQIAIEWSIPTKTVNGVTSPINNTAGAAILADSNILTTTKAGSVTIRATIREFVETSPGVFEQTGAVHFRTGTQQETNDATDPVNAIVKQIDFTIKVMDYIAVRPGGITLTTAPSPVTAKLPTVLTGTVNPSNASYKTIVWSIDRDNTNTGINTTLTEGNILTAETEGTVRLIATIANGTAIGKSYTQTFDLKVNPITGTVISLNKTTLTINMGDSYADLKATVVSNTISNNSILWSSSNDKVAAVDHNGKITATGAGTAVITAKTADGSNKTASCTVTVPANTQKPSITTLSLPDGTADISYNAALAATGAAPIKWTVSTGDLPDDMVLNTDTGAITGVPRLPGTYSFTVTAANGAGSDSRNLTVKVTEPIPVAGISLHADATTLIIGNSTTLRANIVPVNATDKGLVWSTSNAGAANVTANGTITGIAAGEAVITAKTTDGSNRSATCKVTVIHPPVNGVVLNKSSTSMPIGSSETLVATVYPTNAKNRNVVWSTSSTTIATVKDGAVVAVAAGTATITAKTEEGGYIATCVITVTVPVTGVTLNKASATILHGDKDTLTANIVPANATNKNVSWSTSDRTVVTVDSAGLITAVAPGKATVTATTADGGKTATCAVTVNPVPATGITLNKNTTRIPIGDTETLLATISPTNATNKNITWTSGNTTVATVDANGRVTGRAEGTAVITATTADGNLTATCAVTVHTVAVTGISVRTSATIGVGASESLTYSIIPANATNKNVTWTSGNTAVAAVDANGRVTGKAEGTAVITATTADGGFAAACSVKVTLPVAVTGVTLNKKSMSLVQGASETLTATVSPSNATNKNVTWTSGNTTVAAVDANGRVTAKAPGTATITVRTADGGKTAACTVTVEGVYNITVVQAAGGTASASLTGARPGTPVTLTAKITNDGYYATWRVSPPNVIISGNSFIMPESDVTITPVYQRISLIDTYTDVSAINTKNASYNLSLTESVSIPASTLADLGRQNSSFAINAQTPFGIYQVPVNFASIIPGLNSTLSKNNAGINDVTFNIILSDKTSDRGVIDALAKDMPQSKLISAVEFTVEIARLTANSSAVGKTLDTVSNFTQRVTRMIPMPNNMAAMPDNWGVFRYNETSKRFEFVPHTTKTVDGVLYAVVQSTANGIYVVAENTVMFGDVAPNEWYANYVEKAAAKRLVQGTGSNNFDPERNVTRAEFVQMMANALQLPQAGSDTRGYNDVPAAEWYYDAIMKAKSAGLLDKFTSGSFYPDQPITREEMAVILAAAARREKLSPSPSSAVSLSGIFKDYNKMTGNYITDIEFVYRLGIMQGTGGGIFSPKGTTTRAEAATVQIRLLELLGFIV